MCTSLKNSLGLNLPCFSAFFPPCCCSICYLQNTKLWALWPSPPSIWMMPSISCGRRMSPPLLMRCPSSRTGTGMGGVAEEALPTCMALWKGSIPTKSTWAFLLWASTLQALLFLPLCWSMGRPVRYGCPGCDGWAGCGLNVRCWFLSGSQGTSQELCLVWAELAMPGKIRCEVLKETLSHWGTETAQDFIWNKTHLG